MLEPEHASAIIDLINEESARIEYGKLFIEVTVLKGRATNIQAETKRSHNLNKTDE